MLKLPSAARISSHQLWVLDVLKGLIALSSKGTQTDMNLVGLECADQVGLAGRCMTALVAPG